MAKQRDYAAERRRAKELKALREAGKAAPKRASAKVNKAGDKRGMHTNNRGHKWKPGQREKFRASMARRRELMQNGMLPSRQAGKQQLLAAGPLHLNKSGNMRGKVGKRSHMVTVLEADGTIATYVLTTVQVYVRQP